MAAEPSPFGTAAVFLLIGLAVLTIRRLLDFRLRRRIDRDLDGREVVREPRSHVRVRGDDGGADWLVLAMLLLAFVALAGIGIDRRLDVLEDTPSTTSTTLDCREPESVEHFCVDDWHVFTSPCGLVVPDTRNCGDERG